MDNKRVNKKGNNIMANLNKKGNITKNDWIFIGVIIAFVILFCSIFIFARMKADNGLMKYTSKEGDVFKFRVENISGVTFYRTYIFNGYDYLFRYSPFDVENIPAEKNIVNLLNRPGGTQTIYITQDIDFIDESNKSSVLSIAEFSRILGTTDYGVFQINTRNALTTTNERLPAITCANVSDTTAVIYLKEGENKIYSQGNCLIIQGTKEDIIKVGTRFAYYLANILPS